VIEAHHGLEVPRLHVREQRRRGARVRHVRQITGTCRVANAAQRG
jgi:hypothetical protein